MREIEIGDAAAFIGVVDMLGDLQGRITTPNGDMVWVPRDQLQLVEPEPFSVGDRVTTGGAVGIIDKITPREPLYQEKLSEGICGGFIADHLTLAPPKPEYRVGDRVETKNGFGTIDSITPQNLLHRVVNDKGAFLGEFRTEHLTPAPPKPKYHVVRKDDELQLQRIHDNPVDAYYHCVAMSNPEKVDATIGEWARNCGIDADAARKLAAEPEIIDRYKLSDWSYAVAIRHGSGWYVKIAGAHWDEPADSLRYGELQPERIGEAIFPTIEGLYEEKP